jgi:SAM-dependent methyltransferase
MHVFFDKPKFRYQNFTKNCSTYDDEKKEIAIALTREELTQCSDVLPGFTADYNVYWRDEFGFAIKCMWVCPCDAKLFAHWKIINGNVLIEEYTEELLDMEKAFDTMLPAIRPELFENREDDLRLEFSLRSECNDYDTQIIDTEPTQKASGDCAQDKDAGCPDAETDECIRLVKEEKTDEKAEAVTKAINDGQVVVKVILTGFHGKNVIQSYSYQMTGEETAHVPPKKLTRDGASGSKYLLDGWEIFWNITRILGKHGIEIQKMQDIMEMDCDTCGTLRRFLYNRGACRLWGCDLDVAKVRWGMEELSELSLSLRQSAPPLHFESGFFDLVFSALYHTSALSIHPDLHQDWFYEMGRIVKKGGYLYLSILDEASAQVIVNPTKEQRLAKSLDDYVFHSIESEDDIRQIIGTFDFDWITIKTAQSQIHQTFYSRKNVKRLTAPFFEMVDYAPCSLFGVYSVYLMKRG